MTEEMKRVWNITGTTGSKKKTPEMLVVLGGVQLRPGKSMKVPSSVLEDTQKLKKHVEDGLLFVSEERPACLSGARVAEMPTGASRARFTPRSAVPGDFAGGDR